MSFIRQAVEEIYNVNTKTFFNMEEFDSILEEVEDFRLAKQTESILKAKVDRGEDLTDEEIFIAVETIGNIYYRKSDYNFTGFGFEKFTNKSLNQKTKSLIALEAIEEQNKEKLNSIKNKTEDYIKGMDDYAKWFTASMEDLRVLAQETLADIEKTSESDFTKETLYVDRISVALQRGKEKPFTNYKDVLKALRGLIDSLKITASLSKYESLGSGKDSQWDLEKLVKDLNGRIITRTEKSVTYDLNPDKLNGAILTVKMPTNSNNSYLMRNIKANFVITLDYNQYTQYEKSQGIAAKPLTKRESIDLLKEIIKYIDEQDYLFREFYKEAKITFKDVIKNIFKSLLGFILLGYNTVIFRGRVQNLNSKIHFINREVIKGLITWASSSVK